MIAALLLLGSLGVATAATTEVGHGANFGVGVYGGTTNPAFTGKYWLNDKGGVSFYVGAPLFGYVDGRVQYESQFVQIGDWDFADLGMYWDAGVATAVWPEGILFGPAGGVGAEMRFKAVPAAVFIESDMQFYLYNQTIYSLFGWDTGAGGRWYF